MTALEIEKLAEVLAPRLADELMMRGLKPSRPAPPATPAMLPFRLTVRQFACCIQRCEEVVRRDIRAGIIKAKGRPYLISPAELESFSVTQAMAADRLATINQPVRTCSG